jgi:RNA polymerase sigma-70 factor (ECF subfamily)
MSEKREPELIAAAQRGDQTAISELFERHYPSSLVVARRILRSEEDSQDAVQSAYLSAFRNLRSFRGEAAFKTWITRIVTNYCLLRFRQPWRRTHSLGLDVLSAKECPARLTSPGPTPEVFTFRREIAVAVSNATAALPKPLCDVFRLHVISGLSVKQVAAATGLTLPATKSRLFRAKARMRQRLQPVWSNAFSPAMYRNSPVQEEAA